MTNTTNNEPIPASEAGLILKPGQYDALKRLVTIILPAIGALYFGMAQIWGLPKAEEVVGTCAVLATFGGTILGLSSRNFNRSDAGLDGNLVVTEDEDGLKQFSLQLEGPPETLERQDRIAFAVIRQKIS